MAKRKSRKPFPQYDQPSRSVTKTSYVADEAIGGVFGFFRDFGTRETIESILVAIILALMFRAFEAEAFIIPTGSMAPSLQGAHKDLECENCRFRYRVGASQESSIDPESGHVRRVKSTYCPICQYETPIKRNVADHATNSGDRILVNKFIYDFSEPQRYDVIVFKNPNNSKQNYIKRLIGLPGDNILIENGDIFLLDKKPDGTWDRKISRKPPHKLRHILQTVDDTFFIGSKLKAVDWPLRWQPFEGGDGWERVDMNGNPGYISQETASPTWLRYRHFRPFKSEWETIEHGDLPSRFRQKQLPTGRLISDQYAYNDYIDEILQGRSERNQTQVRQIDFDLAAANKDLGLHWVGDIGVECWADVKSATGKLLLDVVEGGAHFVCEIDVATGRAKLKCEDPAIRFHDSTGKEIASPTAQTSVKGLGEYHLLYMNADDRIHLWINNRLVTFDAAEYDRDGIAIPKYSPRDPGDAEPAGIAAENLEVRLSRLKVVRDIYYTSVKGHYDSEALSLENETGERNIDYILRLQESPAEWNNPDAIEFFGKKKNQTEPMFQLKIGETADQDQFLPMGDNSPHSLDGRVWDGPNFVERDLLIGRGLFVYWPHTLNEPVKYFPNFGGMGFIR